MICASIGTVLLHTPVRDGASKGKWRGISGHSKKDGFTDSTSARSAPWKSSMSFWRHISGNTIRQSIPRLKKRRCPLSAQRTSGKGTPVPEWLDECFLNRTTRRVSRDATVELDSLCYDAPMQFIGQKVEVRYLPDDPEKVWVFSEGKRYPMRLTNRVENGKAKRESIQDFRPSPTRRPSMLSRPSFFYSRRSAFLLFVRIRILRPPMPADQR